MEEPPHRPEDWPRRGYFRYHSWPNRAKGWGMVAVYILGVFLVGAGVYLLLRLTA